MNALSHTHFTYICQFFFGFGCLVALSHASENKCGLSNRSDYIAGL